MKEALAILTKARAALLLDQPFFGSLAVRMRLVEDSRIPTLAVDGRHIFYNADFVVRELNSALAKAAMAHEVMHCVWSHIARRGKRDPNKWNCAGDYAINYMLKHLKDNKNREIFEIGSKWLYNKKYDETWSVDKIYNDLPDQPGGGPGTGQPGGALCDVMDGPPDTAHDDSNRAQSEREWKVATIQAANSAKMQGKLPGDLERFLDALYKPQINWREKLRNFVNQTTRNDYNWMRPNKRFLPGLYMPSLHDETVGEIAVVIDDSGSINQATLDTFASEILGIMQDVRPAKTHLIYCDAAVSHYTPHDPDDTPEFKVHGGGGTDFRPPFNFLVEQEVEPLCLIYLTDLMGPHGDDPGYPVLWVCINDRVAPWGETVHIDMKGEN